MCLTQCCCDRPENSRLSLMRKDILMPDYYAEVLSKADSFTKKLYESCAQYVNLSARDPFHDYAEQIINVLFLWLWDNGSIDADTGFNMICSAINDVAVHFFTLDTDKCSEITRNRWTTIRQDELQRLEYNQKAYVLDDLRVVFDLTCAGMFAGAGFIY